MNSITKTKIFAGIACIGVLGTAITSFKAGGEFLSVYEMYIADLNYSGESKEEVRKRYLPKFAKVLAPSFGSAAATIALIILMGKTSVASQKALIGALAVAKTQIEWTARDPEGLKKAEQLEMDIRKDEIKEPKDSEIVIFEPYTGQIITTTEKRLDKAIKMANKKLQNRYLVRLNTVVKAFGGDECDFGTYMGWEMDNDVQMYQWDKQGGPIIDFIRTRTYDVKGKEIVRVDWCIPPRLLIDTDS